MKLKTYLTAGLFALGAPLAAHADLSFDTEGGGGAVPGEVVEIDAFDWVQNSFLAENGNLAIINFVTDNTCPNQSCTFTVYTQGTLNSATLAGSPVWSPQFSETPPVEITYTLSFTEVVTAVNVNGTTGFATARFAVDTAGPVRFEMYYDTSVDANAVSGSGYSDGTLILYGNQILNSTGTFTITTDTTATPIATQNIDQNGANDYTGQFTVPGNGSQGTIEIGGLVQDNNFFLDQLAAFGFDFSNLSQELPFTNVTPSDCFNATGNVSGGLAVGSSIGANGCNTAHVNGTYEQNEAGATGLVPRTSSINGFPTAGEYGGELCNARTCPDFVAQTDPNSGIQVQAPEPGVLALTGLGLLLLGARRRHNRV